MRDDFGVFILSHGRPDLIAVTIGALRKARYTGKWWIVLDTDDETAEAYAHRWGADRILTFDKDEVAKTFDLADNDGPRGVIVYARNAVDGLAADLGLTYCLQLDDDYPYFGHRMPVDDVRLGYAYIYHLDDVLDAMIRFLEDSGALTVTFAQGGDYIGGLYGITYHRRPLLRKAMNTFVTRVGRPIRFVGRINEDVNTYTLRGSQGELFFTLTDIFICQKATQAGDGGMTGAYLDSGTYRKSFYSVMHCPSSVKITTLGEHADRIHHEVAWNNTVPKIISGEHRKVAS